MEPSKTASGDWTGSTSNPTNDSKDATVDSMRSLNISRSSITSNGGASRELKIDTGIPAWLPGVKTLISTSSCNRLTRPEDCPQSSIPSYHILAVFSANSSGDSPFFRASSSLIHGRKSSLRNSGKVSSKLEMSPFGSMTIAGMRYKAASSSKPRHNPVFPDPVIPNTTPWVTRSLES